MSKKRSSSRNRKPIPKKWMYAGVAFLTILTFSVVALVLNPKSSEVVNQAAPKSEQPAATQTAVVVPEALPVLNIERPTTEPLRVLFVGDSLAGSLHASVESKGFRPLMVEALSQGGAVDERHGHKSGGSAGEVAQLVEIGESNQLAIIELGTNDVGKTELDQFRTVYQSLLTTIRASSPDVQFLCAGTWQNADLSAPYDRVIHEECGKVDGLFVPLTDLHVTEANRGPAGKMDVFGGPSDTFHPNDTGYAAIADRLLSKIDAT